MLHFQVRCILYSVGRLPSPKFSTFQTTILKRRWQTTLSSEKPTVLNRLLLKKAEQNLQEFKKLTDDLSKGVSFDVDNQKKYAKLSSICNIYENYMTSFNDCNELKQMIESDPTLREEAELELKESTKQLSHASSQLMKALLPSHPFASEPCIIELRPGAGGIEAMIFTQDLLNMYINYCHNKKWKYTIMEKNENESGDGIIDATITIDQPGSYDRLRFEAGVHRVQRIPATETKGRTHTSTAAVVVLPKVPETGSSGKELREFKPDEVRIDIMRARGKGGQHVNTTDSAVRLTHLPTGIVVSMQDERSQHKNKAKAYAILRARLLDKEQREKDEKERSLRKDQVTTTDRSDKIRTYNYPQNRVTDHRCGYTLYALDAVMNGTRLDEVIDAISDYETFELSKKELIEPSNN
ncbi:Mrf1p NDAI_0H03300 [Naumovozyma dairenensis CBS 421]|uniref:Peptide chain release factor 1, mitochondrial n=1 Tax=Naumovozyma dairenensis (strain ATCC 10597 / BCRC 20456 / CBS 421 / NBRC 0211 / NRRL Y-12639) TaxID=1071378 RepID=G0WFE2_NAUDC|nr:hypothetical protein NDAI_0H03300 [Naumovozyma dairenensis CBS 421]CCD26503.1 hypothetical protein NDAI_0H03300 [Naumovozyma dairenensis CBS 421]